ncbi:MULTISPECIES: MarR family winged helix-turn-helix transcriptional regulator [Acinetobacter]|jgi:DNA-binding MarR family transcriptional regulator|uniref:MarR family transcriptional regulator n=2 Tax=Acinetobacter TaxID=469 RepID=A0A241VFH7_9GAMM|nr:MULTISPECIES: MarR family transcriptional regulator [Acinetobacter]AZN64066.1 MarR family transcriptional regulator [Acinetobacter johnsonii]NNH38740.1 MarR family transcriptional regulator [Acinetobacter terrae]NNH79326.1 MarR family transcriptional regulator [Acinetobacter terrae]NNH89070.1 MarR family transcriptional regulator [Acinetobacter terrae]OAL85979.1 MarR family transcriptional regulator [Acinetobacter terrae]
MTKKYNKFFSAAADFNLDHSPYYWVTQVHAQYVQNVDHALKKYGLDNSRRRILLALKAKPQASVSELSEMVISKMSTTTKIIYRLKDEGLVNTYSCEDDARITRVVLTDKGQQMAQKINDLSHIVLDQSFDGLTPLQIEKMLESLKLIFRNLAH